MPIAFNIDTNVKENASIATIDPQVVTFARSAITSGINLRSEISPVNSNRGYIGDTTPLTADGGPMECIGVPFDTTGTGVGEDFSTAPFGIQMEVGLTTESPNALFLFVHSRQTLVFGPQGLQVIQ